MFGLTRFFGRRLTSNAFDRRFGQVACFAAALGILFFAVKAVTRFATSEFEIAVGLLAAGTVAVSFVTLGVVLRPSPRVETDR